MIEEIKKEIEDAGTYSIGDIEFQNKRITIKKAFEILDKYNNKYPLVKISADGIYINGVEYLDIINELKTNFPKDTSNNIELEAKLSNKIIELKKMNQVKDKKLGNCKSLIGQYNLNNTVLQQENKDLKDKLAKKEKIINSVRKHIEYVSHLISTRDTYIKIDDFQFIDISLELKKLLSIIDKECDK